MFTAIARGTRKSATARAVTLTITTSTRRRSGTPCAVTLPAWQKEGKRPANPVFSGRFPACS
ncbi:hypothetical protein GCM10010486_01340 [Nonomuraea roseoviolacea subsp. carminata]